MFVLLSRILSTRAVPKLTTVTQFTGSYAGLGNGGQNCVYKMDRFVPLVLKFLLEDDCCRRLGVECKADRFYFHRLEFSTLGLSELNLKLITSRTALAMSVLVVANCSLQFF